jgi:hypothetical protein
MSLRKGQKGPVEGGDRNHPTNEGNIKNVKNEGTADGQVGRSGPRSSTHGRDKSIGR